MIPKIAHLIKAKIDGSISPLEEQQLLQWAEQDPSYQALLDRLDTDEGFWKDVLNNIQLKQSIDEHWDERLDRLTFEKIDRYKHNHRSHRSRPRRYLQYTGLLLLFSAIGIYFYIAIDSSASHIQVLKDISPTYGTATLELSDGTLIPLDADKRGIVVGADMRYQDGSSVGTVEDDAVSYATLKVPQGGKYQVTLSDGTKVWLNSGSTLKYPIRFSDSLRSVELDGEGYFDVAHQYYQKDSKADKRKTAFIVTSATQSVEVLGTIFNIKAYADDVCSKTTLLYGAVRLKSSTVVPQSVHLSPGEQGILTSGQLHKKTVNIKFEIGWLEDKFIFRDTELREALKELSRWYGFEIKYERNVPPTHFYGEINRNSGLIEVLKILKSSGLEFRIEQQNGVKRLVVL